MDETKALSAARRLYGDVVLSVTSTGDCVISVKENGHYIPLGYGETWEDALIDCARQYAFA
jgi:hypothetical protein